MYGMWNVKFTLGVKYDVWSIEYAICLVGWKMEDGISNVWNTKIMEYPV